MEIRQPPSNNLPLVSLDIEQIFVKFTEEQIIEIFKHILIETKIIFFSSEISLLTPIIEGYLALIFPLKYSYNYVSILPKEHFAYMESSDPYIIGINLKYDKDIFKNQSIDISKYCFLIVDIDEKKLEYKVKSNMTSYNITSIKSHPLTENIELPKNCKNIIIEKLKNFSREMNMNKKKEDLEIVIKKLRIFFLNFMVNLLFNYSKFIDLEYIQRANENNIFPDQKRFFKAKEFLESVSNADLIFYTHFVSHTRIFSDFISRAVLSKDLDDKIDITFFDENIIVEKNNCSLFSKPV